jgi:hypothetical protein
MPNKEKHPHEQERDELVARIKALGEQDERVRAAWLFGSLGRGTADVLSDIDVFFVVADEHLAEIASSRRSYVAQAGSLTVLVEGPQNGAYLMAWYYGELGPIGSDWYWQPKSQAVIPAETVVLFDKDGLPRSDKSTHFDGYQPTPEISPWVAAQNAWCFAWAMLWITGKYAVRSPHEPRMELLRYSLNAYNEVRRFCGLPEISFTDESLTAPTPEAKFEILEDCVAAMASIMFTLEQNRIAPIGHLTSDTERYLNLLRSLVK